MMMFFGKILPLLFVNPSNKPNIIPSSSCSIKTTKAIAPTTITSQSALKVSESSTEVLPRKIINDVREIYRSLSEGCFTYSNASSPTIHFHYLSPTQRRAEFRNNRENGIDGNGNEKEKDVTDDNFATVYKEIKRSNSKDGKKPILLYLPGLDGVGISASQQFDDLSNNFEFWRMTIDKQNDLSSFTDLTTAVTNFIFQLTQFDNDDREVILLGESFGGLLAPSVALRVQSKTNASNQKNPIIGMTLVNPATSFDRTQWNTFAPLLASIGNSNADNIMNNSNQSTQNNDSQFKLPTPYSILGGMALAVTVPDSTQFQSIVNMITDTKVDGTDELQDVLSATIDSFDLLEENLPANVIRHRVGSWCNVGCQVVNKRLHLLDTPTLVIAGEDDNMLPTKEEADRLLDVMKDVTVVSVKGSGHFVLDDRFNLTKAMLDDAPFLNNKEGTKEKHVKYDPILDWTQPTPEELREAVENRVTPLRRLTSPKFFSTGTDGIRRVGLGQVPRNTNHDDNGDNNRPLLFVANHQLLGLDLGLIIAELLEQRGIAARGLAHPVVFQGGQGGGGGFAPGPGARRTSEHNKISKRNKDGPIIDDSEARRNNDFQTFGAVMVTPRNYYRLMQTGQAGLLFPGGVREVFHGKDEAYELFWPEGKVDFVRVAAKFNATIVPISAIGAADSANILIDAPDMVNLPFGLGDRVKNNTQNVIAARFDQDNTDELFVPPLVVPKLTPARHYFIFGKPFDTSMVDPSKKEDCKQLYDDVKAELRKGLDDLLVAREKDPYKDFPQRAAIEQVTGKQAPTFPIEELNKIL